MVLEVVRGRGEAFHPVRKGSPDLEVTPAALRDSTVRSDYIWSLAKEAVELMNRPTASQ